MNDSKEVSVPWHTSPELWEKLKPEARRMRHDPTPSEERLWQRLRNRQLLRYKFRRQHAVGQFIVDFYCAKAQLVIEVDGPIHKLSKKEDAIRQKFLESLGFRVVRFTNNDVDKNLDGVLEKIREVILSSGETR